MRGKEPSQHSILNRRATVIPFKCLRHKRESNVLSMDSSWLQDIGGLKVTILFN